MRDDESRGATGQRVAQEHLGARGQVGHGDRPPVDAVPDHAPEPRDEALEAVDLFAADVDLLGVERGVGRVAPEDGPEEVDGVAHLVRDLGGDRLDEREALGLPRGGLLLPASLELGVAMRVRQREPRLVDDRAEQVDVVAREERPAALAADREPAKRAPTERGGDAELVLVLAGRGRARDWGRWVGARLGDARGGPRRNVTLSQGSQRRTVRSTASATSLGSVIDVSSSLSCSMVGLYSVAAGKKRRSTPASRSRRGVPQ